MSNSTLKNINNLIDSISELSIANTITGIWDNKRHQLCKKKIKEIDLKYLVKCERIPRFHVEMRAKKRNKIEEHFIKLVNTFIK